MLDVMVGLVIEVRLVGHARADHVEGDAIEMAGGRGEVGGEVFQAPGRTMHQDQRRI
jgi:hypothetical protein